MQRTNKKSATYLGMAFLLLSVTITPLSLKSIGLSPSLTAGIDAWRQISSVFGDSHQPVTSSELLALNKLNSGDITGTDSGNGIEQSMIAELQPEMTGATDVQMSTEELRAKATCNQHKPCSKSANQPLRAIKRVEIASIINPDIEIQTPVVEPMLRPVVVINKADFKNFEKHLSQYTFDVGGAMKFLPVKDLRVMVKLKSLSLPVISCAPKCNSRKAPVPEPVKDLRQRAVRASATDPFPVPTTSENCEL